MRARHVLSAAAAAALAAGLGAAPASAQDAPQGLAAFESVGSRLEITGPSELDTTPSLVPERDDFAFLGDPGDLVWVAGTDPDGSLPTLDTTAVSGAPAVEVEFAKTSGPGEAWLYTFTGPGIAEPLASSGDDAAFELAAGTSTVVVLAVDRPGEYTVELTAEPVGNATGHGYLATADGARPQGDTEGGATYTLVAEEADAAEVQAALAAGDEEEAQAQSERSCIVVDAGHVDIGPRFVDGEWTAQLRDDRESESVWRELSDVVLHLPDAALFPIPEGEAFAFLGEAGEEIWMLPQTQQSDVVWPGWNTQDPSVIEAVPGSVDWNLVDVAGPGHFTLFLTGTFGDAQVLFDSGESLPQTIPVPRNTHAHGNWTFSEAGVYHLTVEFAASTSDGEPVADEQVVRIAVGDATDPQDACDASGGSGDGSDDDSGGWLPTTGAGWILWGLIAAAVAVVVGVVLMVLTRGRRRPATAGGGDET